MISIPINQLQQLLLCTFRYALHRKTYIVSDCVKLLTDYWEVLPYWMQKQIQYDIINMIETEKSEEHYDTVMWRQVLVLPLKEDGR